MLGLRYADRQVSESELGTQGNVFFRIGCVDNAVCSVDFAGHRLQLLFDGQRPIVERAEVRRFSLEHFQYGLSEFTSAFSAFGNDVGDGSTDPSFLTVFPDHLKFSIGIGGEAVYRHYDGQTELTHALYVVAQVGQSGL